MMRYMLVGPSGGVTFRVQRRGQCILTWTGSLSFVRTLSRTTLLTCEWNEGHGPDAHVYDRIILMYIEWKRKTMMGKPKTVVVKLIERQK